MIVNTAFKCAIDISAVKNVFTALLQGNPAQTEDGKNVLQKKTGHLLYRFAAVNALGSWSGKERVFSLSMPAQVENKPEFTAKCAWEQANPVRTARAAIAQETARQEKSISEGLKAIYGLVALRKKVER